MTPVLLLTALLSASRPAPRPAGWGPQSSVTRAHVAVVTERRLVRVKNDLEMLQAHQSLPAGIEAEPSSDDVRDRVLESVLGEEAWRAGVREAFAPGSEGGVAVFNLYERRHDFLRNVVDPEPPAGRALGARSSLRGAPTSGDDAEAEDEENLAAAWLGRTSAPPPAPTSSSNYRLIARLVGTAESPSVEVHLPNGKLITAPVDLYGRFSARLAGVSFEGALDAQGRIAMAHAGQSAAQAYSPGFADPVTRRGLGRFHPVAPEVSARAAEWIDSMNAGMPEVVRRLFPTDGKSYANAVGEVRGFSVPLDAAGWPFRLRIARRIAGSSELGSSLAQLRSFFAKPIPPWLLSPEAWPTILLTARAVGLQDGDVKLELTRGSEAALTRSLGPPRREEVLAQLAQLAHVGSTERDARLRSLLLGQGEAFVSFRDLSAALLTLLSKDAPPVERGFGGPAAGRQLALDLLHEYRSPGAVSFLMGLLTRTKAAQIRKALVEGDVPQGEAKAWALLADRLQHVADAGPARTYLLRQVQADPGHLDLQDFALRLRLLQTKQLTTDGLWSLFDEHHERASAVRLVRAALDHATYFPQSHDAVLQFLLELKEDRPLTARDFAPRHDD